MQLDEQQINSLAGAVVGIRRQLETLTVGTLGSSTLEITTQLDSIVGLMKESNFDAKPTIALEISPSRYDSMVTAVVSIQRALKLITVDNLYTVALGIGAQLDALTRTVVEFTNLNPVRADSKEVSDTKKPPPPPPPPNDLPTALIESIKPNPANEGELVEFIGSGTDPDGTVVGYEWSDGGLILSDKPTWTSDKMTPGIHTISLVVIDDKGGRSSKVDVNLEIIGPLDTG